MPSNAGIRTCTFRLAGTKGELAFLQPTYPSRTLQHRPARARDAPAQSKELGVRAPLHPRSFALRPLPQFPPRVRGLQSASRLQSISASP